MCIDLKNIPLGIKTIRTDKKFTKNTIRDMRVTNVENPMILVNGPLTKKKQIEIIL